MKKLIGIIILIIIIGFIGWRFVFTKNGEASSPKYKFTEITRGTVENVISGTGTLSPVSTVEVGTRVSGEINKLYADFNDKVTKGQILAILDTTSLSASVRDAEARVLQAQANYDQAMIDYERNQELFDKQYLKESELQQSKTDLNIKKASLLSANLTLEKAKLDLGYAIIKSPINGTVIERSVEEGQTVASNLSAPTLFLIAEDLSQMEILGLVDESDIGLIEEGMSVRFAVEAYFDKEFYGTVQQVRLQPETVSNVVTYTVVIDADNSEGLLYPGMTATIDFIAEQAEDVLYISNKALKFQPSQTMLESFRETMEKRREEHMASLSEEERQQMKERRANRSRPQGGSMMGGMGSREDMAQLWYLDGNSNLAMMSVKKGISDGMNTQITLMEGRPGENFELTEGMQIITDVSGGEIESSEKSNGTKSLLPTPGRMGGGRSPRR